MTQNLLRSTIFILLAGPACLAAQESRKPSATSAPEPRTTTISVRIVPAAGSLIIGSSLTFTAYVSGTLNQAVSWLVNGIPGGNQTVGTIANGIYTAPAALPSPNTVSVQAQSQQSPGSLSSPSTVTLSNPTPSISSISPSPLSYGPFTISVSGAGFVPGAKVTYGSAVLPTTFVSSAKLTATGTAVPIVGAVVPLTVVNPGVTPLTSPAVGVPLQEANPLVSYASAFHFLEQSSFGPTPATIDHLQKIGFQQWFVEQANVPISPYTTNAPSIQTLQSDFFFNALSGPDQLRQRVALALSEIFVISVNKDYQPVQFEPYLQILQTDALGNFYQLMSDITLSPSMGLYLDTANNVKGVNYSLPNENYARELMQLFTTGPVLLNPNGTPQLDGSGNTIPLYTETTIQNFARVFTGWTYPVTPGATPQAANPPYFTGPMVAWEANHDTGSKTLLNGAQLLAGQSAEQDTQAALQNVFNHPNVGPFISWQLIQHLVSSNPSPAYIQRVDQVFNNDGTGTRGNLKAVVQAILLDPEARESDSPSTWIASRGRLREPILFLTSVLRNLNASAAGSNSLAGLANISGQTLFDPLSVAGYYPPAYSLPGYSALLGPEFDTMNSSSGLARVNWVNAVSWGQAGSTGITLDLSPFIGLAADPTGSALVQAMSNLFMAGQMPVAMQNAIATAIASMPYAPAERASTALYLTASSGLYQVQH
jgi:uncharacterized protein (DUF1800 family)